MTFRPFLACAALLASPLCAADVDSPSAGLTVHEWGTFTSVAGPDGSAIEWRPFNNASDLPCFVFHLKTPAFKGGLVGTVRMETPVIYFYTDRELEATATVDFPRGLMTEWYPRETTVGPEGVVTDGTLMQGSQPGHLEWTAVRLIPQGASEAQLPRETAASHYYAARATSAATVETAGAPQEQERFLFYRGVAMFQPPITVQLSGAAVQVTAVGEPETGGVILFENRGGKIGYTVRGGIEGQATIERPNLGADLGQLRKDLEAMLIRSGLFADEAHAMVETWRDSWFETGSRVFYIYPRAELDSTLPLTIVPTPVKTVRVFVGRIELITPEIEQAVLTAAKNNDTSTLKHYGRFLAPILAKLQDDGRATWEELATANSLAFTNPNASACPAK